MKLSVSDSSSSAPTWSLEQILDYVWGSEVEPIIAAIVKAVPHI